MAEKAKQKHRKIDATVLAAFIGAVAVLLAAILAAGPDRLRSAIGWYPRPKIERAEPASSKLGSVGTFLVTVSNPSDEPVAITGYHVKPSPYHDAVEVWHHGTVLFHPACDGIQLGSLDDAPEPQVKAYKEAVGTFVDGGTERTAVATFTGTFRVTRQDNENLYDGPRKFDARAIEDIKVYPRRRS
jgi:hypothetical protein